MNVIVHIGLRESSLKLLRENIQVKDVELLNASEENFKETCKLLQNYQALLIGEEVDNPIRLAQEAYAHDKTISILLIDDNKNHEKIKQALQFSPFIGPTVQSFSNAIGQRMAPIVEDAMQRTAQRRSYATMKASSMQVQGFVPNALEKVRADFTTKVLEEAPIGAVLISGTGIIYSINNYALALFEKSEKEVLGASVSHLFPDATQAEVNAFLLDGYMSEPKRIFEVAWPSGIKYLEVSVAPIDVKASSNYKLVILNNITSQVVAQQRTQAHLEELERLNANLERVNADLDTFVYTASHDLKSPILNIEGLVASLEEELGPSHETVKPELDHIKSSIKRFKQTLEDLTEVSSIQKTLEQEAAWVSLTELLDEVKQLLEREIKETGAEIAFTCEPDCTLFFPKRNLTSILYNLISNAIKYRSSFRKPLIQISTRREDEYFCIVVKDNGVGMPLAKRERIFQLFKRMHSHVKGSGVGLYIVKRIVESNGGKITVESEEGYGSVFEVKLKEYAKGKEVI